METFKVILFYVLLIDALLANVVAWFFRDWYEKNMYHVAKYLPMTKVWTVWYLALVLWIGFLIF